MCGTESFAAAAAACTSSAWCGARGADEFGNMRHSRERRLFEAFDDLGGGRHAAEFVVRAHEPHAAPARLPAEGLHRRTIARGLEVDPISTCAQPELVEREVLLEAAGEGAALLLRADREEDGQRAVPPQQLELPAHGRCLKRVQQVYSELDEVYVLKELRG